MLLKNPFSRSILNQLNFSKQIIDNLIKEKERLKK